MGLARRASAQLFLFDATKAEIETWMKSLPEAQRQAAQGFFTTVRRDPQGRFTLAAYSIEYQGELLIASRLLREVCPLLPATALANADLPIQ